MPAVYAIAVHNVTDPEMLQKYAAGAGPTLAEAEIIAVDTSVRTVEGEPRGRAVILKFADEEAARRWYDSEAYREILPLRLNATSDGWAGLVTAFGD
ncbi:MAG TPA: DUF1330 domain-containing protein [Acidimicrobiales bacterium]|nr:DUF1330 domain-containing protein [Acidimicrobiales bacterium]